MYCGQCAWTTSVLPHDRIDRPDWCNSFTFDTGFVALASVRPRSPCAFVGAGGPNPVPDISGTASEPRMRFVFVYLNLFSSTIPSPNYEAMGLGEGYESSPAVNGQ